MYNGYNYYPPTTNGSSASSPVYLMSYPYQYDPFFMTPGEVNQVDDDDNNDVKTVTVSSKENNENAEKQNVSFIFYCSQCKFTSLEGVIIP